MAEGKGLVSPRGEIRVQGGRAFARGFVVVLEVGGEVYEARIGQDRGLKRLEGQRRGSWWNLLAALGIPSKLQLPVTLLALGLLGYGLTVKEERLFLAFLLSGALTALFVRLEGSGRWHSLEHKAVWALDGRPIPQEAGALKEALRRAPAYHPACGSVDVALTGLLSGALGPFLPVSLALILGVLASELVQRQTLPLPLVALLQAPFLSPPREEELDRAARDLVEVLRGLQVPDQDEAFQPGVEVRRA